VLQEFNEFVALVINFNTSRLTVRCVDSLRATGIRHILLLDNASRPEEAAYLRASVGAYGVALQLIESSRNLGFAAGSNLLIERALENPSMRFVLLLNNDAVALPLGMAAMLRAALNLSADLVGGRMLAYPAGDSGAPDQVDSLGIALYRPLLASNRKNTGERFLGPTGGCAIYSRRLLEELKTLHGDVFDPVFFCYAEDTDLCIRARLLGYRASYVDTPVALHDGQASSGGGFSDFVLYHAIRNSIWTVFKSVPASIMARYFLWFLALHLGIVLRHSLRGKGRIIGRLYLDALRGLPNMWRKRRIIQNTRRIPARRFNDFITPRFYESAYLKRAWQELFAPIKRRL
jgi:GT2 family glycosyltransferase